MAYQFMQDYRLLSNDALHLAVMKQNEILDIVTNDKDFELITNIKVWKPK
jgi:predicted nucleic acid-binding protein